MRNVSYLHKRTIISHCQTNNNIQINRDNVDNGGAAGIFVEDFIDSGDVINISHCQANGNEGNARGHGIAVRISAFITDCVANDNFSRGDRYTFFNEVGLAWGIRLSSGIFDPSQELGFVVERCEANNNFCEKAQSVGIGSGDEPPAMHCGL